jgi:glycosyltransferase involved in cell wall biosynthesis
LSDPLPQISVVIPVFNDARRLRLCLTALAEQTYPRDRFEVLVVDNGSEESPRELVESFPFYRFVEEPQPGSYAARNRGLGLARGELLAFTDSDCIPTPGWLAAGERALADQPESGFVGGRIEIFPRDERPTAVELYDMFFGLRQHNNVAEFQHAATANMFTRRSVIDRCGPFDDRVKSGGDFEWGQRVTAEGLPGIYCEAAVVRHPARRTWSDLVRQKRRHAGGRFDRHAESDPYRYTSWRFWRAVWLRLFPKIGRLREARRELMRRGYGWSDWLRVSAVILGLQYATAFEFVRMWFGKTSERR